MDRVERNGLGIAAAGHVALFAALSLGLFAAKNKLPAQADPIEVMFVDEVGLKSAAPQSTPEPPAPSEAPEVAPPTEAPPPSPAVAPPAKPAPAAPAPKPAPQPAVKPTPAAALPDMSERRRPDRLAGAMAAISAAARSERKPTGSRLGSNFLKGITPEKSEGRSRTPQASAVSAQAMAGLAAAIAAQVKPCYSIPAGGTDAERIVTVLRLRFNQDGSVATAPAVVEHNGVTEANQPYVRQMDDAAKRAVLRCAPLRLPPQLYAGGWEDIVFNFRPEAMD